VQAIAAWSRRWRRCGGGPRAGAAARSRSKASTHMSARAGSRRCGGAEGAALAGDGGEDAAPVVDEGGAQI
jgi:hypothetical protein